MPTLYRTPSLAAFVICASVAAATGCQDETPGGDDADSGHTGPTAGSPAHEADAASGDGGTSAELDAGPDAAQADGSDEPGSGAASGTTAPPIEDAGVRADGGPSTGTAPTFTMLFDTILGPTIGSGCNGIYCHFGGAHASLLQMMTKQQAYDELVDQDAEGSECGSSGLKRVVPGDPDNSLLVQKLEGTASCGVRMPKDLDPLSTDQIALIRAWIEAGAKND
jgi:hypothetical protein